MFYFFDALNKNIKEGLYGKSGLMYKGEKGNYLKYYQIGNGKSICLQHFLYMDLKTLIIKTVQN